MRAQSCLVATIAGAVVALASTGHAQVRIAQWNITNWQASNVSARGAAFQSALYGVNAANGLQFAPDLLIAEEIIQGGTGATSAHQTTGQANVNAFLNLLNTASGSPGDWAAAPYVANGGDTGNALFYRTSKITWLETLALTQNTGTGTNQAPRDTQRWRVRVYGYAGAPAELYLYGAHFKAGDTSADQVRRNPEALRIRADANALPANAGGFLIGADTNMQASSQLAYQYMIAYDAASGDVRSSIAGQFNDPINSPGSWNNNAAFQFIHTQEPATQMDDRHDQLLVSGSLVDLQGLSYIFARTTVTPSNPFGIPGFSASTWNDPAHTYRCWGNDGGHYNSTIVSGGANGQVGLTIANDLITTVAGNGHLPVYLDMQVPAKLGAPSGTIDFGTVAINSAAIRTLQITNAADVARFSKPGSGYGIDALSYGLAATSGFGVAAGPFERTATGAPVQANTHTISMDTAASGPMSGTLTISCDDPDNPIRVIQLVGLVQNAPNYDVNGDGVVDIEDLFAWMGGPTDVNGDGAVNDADRLALAAYLRLNELGDIATGRR